MVKMTLDFLTDFCKETGRDMKNKNVVGYDMADTDNGKVRIDLEVIKNDRSGISGRTEFIHTDVVELMSYIHQKLLTNI